MDHLVLQVVLLCIALCFCPLQSQDNSVLIPTFLNVSTNLDRQQLLLEWDVNDEAYNSEKQMTFNIQINQTGANNVVWNKNYTATLNQSNRPIRWSWDAKEPMECMSYAVRIRSLVISKDGLVSESWSDWTKLTKVEGTDIEDSKSYIFPVEKVVEEGSNISFCCIEIKGKRISWLDYGDKRYSAETSHRRMVFTVKNVPLSKPGGVVVSCGGLATVFVTRPPGEPKYLSCETEDMVTLNCTWQPSSDHNLAGKRSIKFNLSDASKGKIDCLPLSSKNSCTFKIGTQTTYNLTLEAKNALGKNRARLNFDVAHRVHPAPPFGLEVSFKNATAVELGWKMKHKLNLLCQVENRHPNGKVDLHNSTSNSNKAYHIVNGLQPYTEYKFQVRCGANLHFWKWSKWSELKTERTEESAPSGHLDVWRSISPDSGSCNVTVFWKLFPSFSPNGVIKTYEIFWEVLGKRPESKEVPASYNYIMLSLDNCSCNISVSAKNSVTSSSPSVMAISAASENDHTWEINTSASKEDTINNTATGIYISWKPQSQFDGYIVDWCNHPRVQPCDFQWKKFGQNQSSAVITSDAFKPGVRYSFRVYGSHSNTASLLEKKAKYLKELEPDTFPELYEDSSVPRVLTLTWNYDHLNDSLPGFIRGYSVFVKERDGNCTLEGSEKLVFRDGSVICRYTVEEPTKKSLTVKHPGLNKEYWLDINAFSTSPLHIPDDIMEETPRTKKVNIQRDRTWIFRLLSIPAVISVMLLFCVCFWRSNCVRNCCCPKVSHPIVTPIKVIQAYPKTLLAPNDFTPNDVLVEECKLQPWSCDEKRYYNQDLHAEMPDVEAFNFQNITYITDGSNCYQSLPTQEAARQKLELASASYQPLQCFTPLNNLTNVNYVSQMNFSFPGVMQHSQAGPLIPWNSQDYKPQQTVGSEEETIDIL
ncbi:LOW QUALITY PROTEIN: oncostatin-M-specific receptor subunit beta [Heteronotia binoei]|uniref:LOW QUALITY PROTEIN: oncostatin-M-specific receptor subunit beta n=1 Tax=Heteronotia binoei TaxID=13085 RepID=UPI00292D8A40|nr:LOW QUALITY PROTEIN: oncostatin-M-specific receptor subunit beta [Heteronotia binoei]